MTSPSPTRRGLEVHRSIGGPASNAVNDAEYKLLMQEVERGKWKNRYLVSAKLPAPLYEDFTRWCRERDLSFNEALKLILRDPLAKPQP